MWKGHCALKHKHDIVLFPEDVDGTADSALSHCGIEVLAPVLDGGAFVFRSLIHSFPSNPCFDASLPI